MKHILLFAYAVSPTKGSEYSVAWTYITKMSKYCKLTVLCGASGDHIGDVAEIEQYIRDNEMPNVRFVYVRSSKLIDALNVLNRRNILKYSFYVAYNFWHKKAYRVAKKIVNEENYDLIHYLNPIGYREPGYLWKLDIPYMWGPICGMTNVNTLLIQSLSKGGLLKYKFRALINNIQLHYSQNIRRAIRRSDVVIAATSETQNIIERVYQKKAFYTPENAIAQLLPLNEQKFKTIKPLEFVFVGRLDWGKSLITALTALTRMKNRDSVRLNVVGDGYLKPELVDYCNNNNLNDIVVWHGRVERDDVFEIMNRSHLHILTSISEANTTVIFEAMSVGLPTLSLDHCGMHDTVNDECGFLINIESSDQIVNDIAAVLDRCVDDPTILRDKAHGMLRCREKYSWAKREEFMLECYDKTIENFNKRKRN